MTAPDVRVTISADDESTEVFKRVLEIVRRLEAEERRAARAAAGAGASTRGFGTAARAAARDVDQLTVAQRAAQSVTTSLTRQILTLVGALSVVRGLGQFTGTGLRFNEIVESSTLGIASLISAQGQLYDANGVLLTGTRELGAAMDFAGDQVQKLRVQGLQTAATTEQLVEAFQSAVASGLSAGLTLDQIRVVTVQIVQAATAIGVPLNQLNQEVRSILDGTIDRNSRVANVLRITNEEVKAAKEQGRLQDLLNQKLEAFATAGERAQQTFGVIRSNLGEAVQVFAGAATIPLFESFKRSVSTALLGAFDFDRATIAPAFEGVVQLAQQVFDGIGTGLATAIAASIEGARDLSTWFEVNRLAIEATFDAAQNVAGELAGLAATLLGIVAAAVDWGVRTGIIAGVARTIAITVEAIRENLALIAIIAAGAGIAKALAFIGGVSAIPTAIGLAGLAVISAPFTALAIAIAGAAVAYNVFRVAQERARRETLATNAAQTRAAREAPALIAEYRKLATAIEEGALKGEDLKRAQERLKTLKDQLIALSPEFRNALNDETTRLGEQASAAQRVADNLKKVRDEKVKDAQGRLAQLEADAARLQREATIPGLRPGRDDAALLAARAELDATLEKINQVKAELGALGALPAPTIRLPGVTVQPGRLEGPPPPVRDRESELARLRNDLKQRADAETQAARTQLERQKALLDEQLADIEISYRDYYARLAAAQQEANRRQQAALQGLLDNPLITDAGERAKILADLEELKAAETRIVLDAERQRATAVRRLQDQVTDAKIDLLRLDGRAAEAESLALEQQFRELVLRLMRESDAAGSQIVAQLFDQRKAQAAIDQIERTFQRASRERALAEESVQVRVDAGILSERQARAELLAIYEQQRERLAAILPVLQQMAASSQNATDVTRLREYVLEYEKLQLLIRQTGDEWVRLGLEVANSFEDSLAEFLSRGVDEAENGLDALRGLVLSLVQDLRSAVSRELAQEATGALTRVLLGSSQLTVAGIQVQAGGNAVLAGAAALAVAAAALQVAMATGGQFSLGTVIQAGASALGFVPGFATGGPLHGPGTGTSDSMLIRASTGEYVVNAESTRRNFPVIDAINRDPDFLRRVTRGASLPPLRLPRFREGIPGFAAGGLVAAGAASGGAAGGNIDGTIELDLPESVLMRGAALYFATRDGQRHLLNVVAANRKAFAAASGGR